MIKERLLALPVEIENITIEIINKQQELEDIKAKMKVWELMKMAEISNEVDDKGKAIYSNDTKRQAELHNRKNESDVYEDYSNMSKSLEQEIAMLDIKVDKLFNEQGNLRAICRLGDE